MYPLAVQPQFEFELSGGALCLDFANTVSRRKIPDRSVDHLVQYRDLVAFAEQAKILPTQQAGELRLHALRHSNEAEVVLRRAISYRENIFRAFSARARGKTVPPRDLRQISEFAVAALAHRHLIRAVGGYRWEWEWNTKNELERILWPITQSAAELLTSSQLGAIRICEAPDCAWLFLDQSRNRSRRWCDMKVCGNRQKARRHYRRTHR